MANQQKRAFISYVREDADRVDRLCARLAAANIPYWRDRADLAPGDDWRREIVQAIQNGSVFLACFSDRSASRTKSYQNEELTVAAEEFRQYPSGASWLIPVRFSDDDLPHFDLGAGRTLNSIQRADLFGDADQYTDQVLRLVTQVTKVMGGPAVDADAVAAAIEQASSAARGVMLRDQTRALLLNDAHRIELTTLIETEVARVVDALSDTERFPIDGTHSANWLLKEIALINDLSELTHPLCAAAAVAGRYSTNELQLRPWTAALHELTVESDRIQSGLVDLLAIRKIPALLLGWTVAFATVSQDRFDLLKSALVDQAVADRYTGTDRPLVIDLDPWAPFNSQTSLAATLLYAVESGSTADEAISFIEQQHRSVQSGAASKWLRLSVRNVFKDQYRSDSTYEQVSDRAEVLLGLIARDVMAEAGSWSTWGLAIASRPRWDRDRPLARITEEIDRYGSSWPPLLAGLFGGSEERLGNALRDFASAHSQHNRHSIL